MLGAGPIGLISALLAFLQGHEVHLVENYLTADGSAPRFTRNQVFGLKKAFYDHVAGELLGERLAQSFTSTEGEAEEEQHGKFIFQRAPWAHVGDKEQYWSLRIQHFQALVFELVKRLARSQLGSRRRRNNKKKEAFSSSSSSAGIMLHLGELRHDIRRLSGSLVDVLNLYRGGTDAKVQIQLQKDGFVLNCAGNNLKAKQLMDQLSSEQQRDWGTPCTSWGKGAKVCSKIHRAGIALFRNPDSSSPVATSRRTSTTASQRGRGTSSLNVSCRKE